MLKKSLIVLNVALVLAVGYLLYKTMKKDKELVYVNSPKLFVEFKGMKSAQAELEKKTKSWQSNVDTLGHELEEEIRKFEKNRSNLSAKELKLSEELLRTKQQQFMQYQQAMQQKASEEDRRLQEKLVKHINAFLKEYGQKHNYKFIMGATNMGNIVYAEERYDITDEVLKELNDNYKE